MSDLLDKLQTGINRIAFEVGKVARVSKTRSGVSRLKTELEAYYREAGQSLYELHSAGEIEHEQVSKICATIGEQLQRISDKEREAQRIKAETFVAMVPSVAPVPVSSAGGAEPSTGAGAGAAETSSSPDTDQEAKTCPNCDARVPAEALFCPRCGSRFSQEP